MNNHAGWTNHGICVYCGANSPAGECDASWEAMWEKVSQLNKQIQEKEVEILELFDIIEQLKAQLNNKEK